MICQNAILSDEYMDYIWKADVNPPAEMDLLPYGVCAQYISPSFSVYYISRKEVFGNRTSLPIGDYAHATTVASGYAFTKFSIFAE